MKEGYFSKKIVEWYLDHYRDLPWRNTQDPYKIWLSEIILQQTRVVQGLPYYKKFIQNYPNIKSLADASQQEVLRDWQGLGYYTRARNLQNCARVVQKKFNGKFPDNFHELRQLPGIGDYTAAAIASFAFQERVAVVDGNVYRVLSRIFGIDKDVTSSAGRKFFSALANRLISTDTPGIHNQAVMEFGALHCLPQNPKCDTCIFRRSCFAFQNMQQEIFPVKIKRQKITKRYFYYFQFQTGKKTLMNQRLTKDIWMGLFDFPAIEKSRPVQTRLLLENFFSTDKSLRGVDWSSHVSKEYKHVLSHQIIHARFVEVRWPTGKKLPGYLPGTLKARWLTRSQIEKVPKPVLILRYLQDRNIL